MVDKRAAETIEKYLRDLTVFCPVAGQVAVIERAPQPGKST